MYSTGIFTVNQFKINTKTREVNYLIPFGDVHKFSPNHDGERWNEYLTWAKTKKNCYFVGMGDYMDMVSASEREMLKNAKLHDSTEMTLEDVIKNQIEIFAEELSFMKGRLIGLTEGNHYWQFSSGITSTQMLCQLLGCKYLGVISFTRLSFHVEDQNTNYALDVFAYHGKGASKLLGGSLNRVEDMTRIADANIYLAGHDHRKSIGMGSKLTLKSGNGSVKLIHKKQIFARTGSFLKGYVPEKVSYVADSALSPTDLGVIKIEMTPYEKRAEEERERGIDIHGSI